MKVGAAIFSPGAQNKYNSAQRIDLNSELIFSHRYYKIAMAAKGVSGELCQYTGKKL